MLDMHVPPVEVIAAALVCVGVLAQRTGTQAYALEALEDTIARLKQE